MIVIRLPQPFATFPCSIVVAEESYSLARGCTATRHSPAEMSVATHFEKTVASCEAVQLQAIIMSSSVLNCAAGTDDRNFLPGSAHAGRKTSARRPVYAQRLQSFAARATSRNSAASAGASGVYFDFPSAWTPVWLPKTDQTIKEGQSYNCWDSRRQSPREFCRHCGHLRTDIHGRAVIIFYIWEYNHYRRSGTSVSLVRSPSHEYSEVMRGRLSWRHALNIWCAFMRSSPVASRLRHVVHRMLQPTQRPTDVFYA